MSLQSVLDAPQPAGSREPAQPAEEAKALDLSATQSTAVPDGASALPDLSTTQSTVLPTPATHSILKYSVLEGRGDSVSGGQTT